MTHGKAVDYWKGNESILFFLFWVCFLVKIRYGFVYWIEFLPLFFSDHRISIFIFGYHLIKNKNK